MTNDNMEANLHHSRQKRLFVTVAWDICRKHEKRFFKVVMAAFDMAPGHGGFAKREAK